MGDMMLTTNFLKSRTSTREFKDKEVSKSDLNRINEFLENETVVSGANVRLCIAKNGDEVYKGLQGLAGYGGIMIKAPTYISLSVLDDEPKRLVEGAYLIEKFITFTDGMGLGSCWISLGDVVNEDLYPLFTGASGDIPAILAIGYPLNTKKNDHKYTDRIANSDIVFIDSFDNPATDEQLEQRGINEIFNYAKYAPSSFNSQPWRFLLTDDKLSIYIEDFKGNNSLIDAGIIMYYIDELGKNISSNTKWEIEPKITGEKYTYIASKNL